MRLDNQPTPPALIESQAFSPLKSNQALQSSMASFPTSGLPVLDTTLKDMLLSQGSLMTDLSSLLTKMTAEMHVIDNRVAHLEDCMEE